MHTGSPAEGMCVDCEANKHIVQGLNTQTFMYVLKVLCKVFGGWTCFHSQISGRC